MVVMRRVVHPREEGLVQIGRERGLKPESQAKSLVQHALSSRVFSSQSVQRLVPPVFGRFPHVFGRSCDQDWIRTGSEADQEWVRIRLRPAQESAFGVIEAGLLLKLPTNVNISLHIITSECLFVPKAANYSPTARIFPVVTHPLEEGAASRACWEAPGRPFGGGHAPARVLACNPPWSMAAPSGRGSSLLRRRIGRRIVCRAHGKDGYPPG